MLRKLSILALLLPGMALAGSFEHRGAPVPNQPLVSPYNVDAPAAQALKSILPATWHLYIQETVVLPKEMSWEHTDTWVSALQKLAAQAPLRITADWASQAVYIAAMPSAAAPAPQPVAKPPEAPVSAPIAAQAPPPAKVPAQQEKPELKADMTPLVVPLPATENEWEVTANTSLHDTLATWSSKAGWQLQWDLNADLTLLAGFTHTGDFESAVRAVLAAVKTSGGPDIHAGLYAGNKILRVHAPAF